ncbi:uncharacterized protein C9orf85 homolog [Anabrus simplex]|uniref:uncharacterized protein C9orf85 homolog n=1 Tax=Anabrus simplex TaxID=316456 RepID=UPI0034DD2BB3
MSTQRGNTSRQRAQKYKNVTAFKNDLHDKTPKMNLINSIEVVNVCRKCANILEWKIKYKKYKPLKVPRKCTKCEQKCVKSAYHIMCLPCSKMIGVCPKCGKNEEIVKEADKKEEQFKLDKEMKYMIKKLSERKRRTFRRYMSKQCDAAKAEDYDPNDLRNDLMEKLKSLKVDDDKSDLFDEIDAVDDGTSDLFDESDADEEATSKENSDSEH